LNRDPLFGENDIASQVTRLAREIAARKPRIDIAVPVLTGAFIFAADLLRALSREGLDVPVEFISLTRYGSAREGSSEILVRMGTRDNVKGRNVLLIDGVLDHGHTTLKAHEILKSDGAASIAVVVAVDKVRPDALVKADYAGFKGADAFIVGYGMDDAGLGRGLPFIARA
jgi:hypoxanthine phosphoribosyltransferase